MRERDQRNVDLHHATDLGGEHSAGVDDQFGADLAAIGDDAAHLSVAHLDAGDSGVFADLGAAASRTLHERERQLARVDVPVGREVGRADHPIGGHGRKHAPGFVR